MSNSNNTHTMSSSSTSYSTSHIFSNSNPSSSTTTPTSSTKIATSTQLFTTTINNNNSNNNTGVYIDEETINSKFKQLKMSSNGPASIQLKFKKKNSLFSSSSSSSTSSPLAATSSPSSSSSGMISKSPNTNQLLTSHRDTSSKRLKTRSRSHSRGKYTQLLSAMKNVIKPHSTNNNPGLIENSSLKMSISTQTSFTQSSSPPQPSNSEVVLPESFFFKKSTKYSKCRILATHHEQRLFVRVKQYNSFVYIL
jgi:hypothetical protein